ncbi:MAG: hypothetical protein LWX56_14115 [Ignavibacteria bacterium]|nr:hypothetical protein [Ignavibacteria bacterium]
MKKFLVLFLICFGFALATAILDTFTAKSEGDSVKLEWRTTDEVNVKEFVIERKGVYGSFTPIASLTPHGNNSSYSFTDQNMYKTAASVYVYRLRVNDNSGTYIYSKEISVSHSLSGIKRTWGSIKAMFR